MTHVPHANLPPTVAAPGAVRRRRAAPAGVALAATAALTVSLAGPARAAEPEAQPGSVPGVAVTARGGVAANVDLFWTGPDRRVTVHHETLEAGFPDPRREDLGGVATSGPAGVGRNPLSGPPEQTVYVRGTDDAVWYRRWAENGGGWQSGWTSIGGRSLGAPSATCVGANDAPERVYVRGTDNALWRRIGNGPWRNLGGDLRSDPSAAPASLFTCVIREHVVALGPAGDVRELRGGSWRSVGGRSRVAPAIVLTEGRVDVFARGTDDALWTRTLQDDEPWTAWHRIGGVLTGPPVGAVLPTGGYGTIAVLALGTDDEVWQAALDARTGTWTWSRRS